MRGPYTPITIAIRGRPVDPKEVPLLQEACRKLGYEIVAGLDWNAPPPLIIKLPPNA